MKRRFFSLLEVMIAISILAIAAGSLFFRVNRLIEQKRFETDAGRLKSLLLSSRMLALNTHSDWRLHFHKTTKGWEIRLLCLEDPDLIYPVPQLSQKELLFNDQPIEELSINFFSTGQVRPVGELALQKTRGNLPTKSKLKIPELFRLEENGKIAPFHPMGINKNSAHL